MNGLRGTAAACLALALALPAGAEDRMTMPKVYQGMGTQKGQWKVDWLEAPGMEKGQRPSMTICSDNLMSQSRQSMQKGAAKGAQSECKNRVLKDTSSEAIIETTCKDHSMVIKTTRESDKSLLMEMDSKGGSGDTHAKLRYSYLGPCREGQGAFSLDKNSEQCRKIREQLAKMDSPEKTCAQHPNRDQCVQQIRQAQSQMAGMCN